MILLGRYFWATSNQIWVDPVNPLPSKMFIRMPIIHILPISNIILARCNNKIIKYAVKISNVVLSIKTCFCKTTYIISLVNYFHWKHNISLQFAIKTSKEMFTKGFPKSLEYTLFMSSIFSQTLSPKTISTVFPASKEYFFESKSHYKKRKKIFFVFYPNACIWLPMLKKIWRTRNMDMIDMENHYLVGKRKIFILRNFLNLEINVSKSI